MLGFGNKFLTWIKWKDANVVLFMMFYSFLFLKIYKVQLIIRASQLSRR